MTIAICLRWAPRLLSEGATQAALTSYTNLLLKRADVDASGTTDAADVAALYSHFGAGAWLYDMNVDGVVNAADVSTMVTQEFRTQPGDFNLDGKVDIADYVVWRNGIGSGTQYEQGDANLDGHVDAADFAIWRSNFGFVRQALTAGAGSGVGLAVVPEHRDIYAGWSRFRSAWNKCGGSSKPGTEFGLNHNL